MNRRKIIFAISICLALCAFIGIFIWIFINQFTVISLIVFIVVAYITSIVFSFYVFNSSKSIDIIKVSWLAIILLLPYVGVVLFLLFGVHVMLVTKTSQEVKKNNSIFYKNKKIKFQYNIKTNTNIDTLFNYGSQDMNMLVEKNKFCFIDDPAKLYTNSLDLINSAQKIICVQISKIKSGFWTSSILTALIKKAKSGVKVYVLYDYYGVGSQKIHYFLKKLKKANINVVCFSPFLIKAFHVIGNMKMHNSAIIVDNNYLLSGSFSFSDADLSMGRKFGNINQLAYAVNGKIALNALAVFFNYWLNFSKQFCNKNITIDDIKQISKIVVNNNNHINFNYEAISQYICFDQSSSLINFAVLISNGIYKANKSIKIICPSFLAPQNILTDLIFVYWKNIDVEIVVSSKNKSFMQAYIRKYYKPLVDAKIKIYEYDGNIASKIMMIDDKYTFMGSSNFDYRSLYLNFENQILLKTQDKLFNSYWKTTISNSVLVDNNNFKKPNLIQRIGIWCLNISYPLF